MKIGKKWKLLSQANGSQQGFSLIEVMISITVLMIGLIGLLGVFGLAVSVTQNSQQNMIAKQLAAEAMESIFTARDTAQLDWSLIDNVGSGGIFLDNMQPINLPGANGLVGTANPGAAEVLTEPGSDGIMGTSDDVFVPLTNYQRGIQITTVKDSNNNVIPSLRQVTITVQYSTPGFKIPKTYVLTSYISQYR